MALFVLVFGQLQAQQGAFIPLTAEMPTELLATAPDLLIAAAGMMPSPLSGAANLDDDAIVHRPPALSRALRVFVPGLRAHR